jgi:hypothetical protein
MNKSMTDLGERMSGLIAAKFFIRFFIKLETSLSANEVGHTQVPPSIYLYGSGKLPVLPGRLEALCPLRSRIRTGLRPMADQPFAFPTPSSISIY